MSGHLVTLEGIDNAGKTSLCEALKGSFPAALVTPELTTEVGTLLKQALRRGESLAPEEKVLLFAADRLERQRTTVDPAIARGQLVLADRWVHSARAYRGGETQGEGKAALERYVRAVNEPCRRPDLALYVDIPVAVSVRRQKGSDPLPPADYLERVRNEYLAMVEQGDLEAIDGNRPLDAVAGDIAHRIQALIGAPPPA